jgi:5,10-methylenetetrahydromethanopterin reductase
MTSNRKNTTPVKFFVALRGDKKPKEYIRLAKLIENLGYHRIYVYDDLMFYSSSQILALMAEHTDKIELGPCLVNGFYRHPAIIAQEVAFLNELAPNRVVTGIGRGAFFDFYNMDDSEEHTRQGVLETTMQVERLLSGQKSTMKGRFFNATEKAFLRVPRPEHKVPIVLGSWNPMIAKMAGEYADELQVAEVWNKDYLALLKNNLMGENQRAKSFNIGGMSCISYDKEKAFHIAKNTAAVYIPYLNMLLEKYGYNTKDEYFQNIFNLSRNGEYAKSASLISDEIIERVSLVGNPEKIVERLILLHDSVGIDGVMMSPPYGTGSLEENLELIMEKVIKPVNDN